MNEWEKATQSLLSDVRRLELLIRQRLQFMKARGSS